MNSLLSFWRRFAPQTPLIVNLARESDPAVSAARGLLPEARMEQMAAAGLPRWMAEHGQKRIDLLRVDSADELQGLEDLFFRNRVDAVIAPANTKMAQFFAYHQLNIFAPGDGPEGVRQTTPDKLPADGEILALHHRFTTPVLAGGQHMDLAALFKRYTIEARGVIHIGAHEGEEMEIYARMGFKRVLFIEANPAVYQRLSRRLQGRPGVVCILCAMSDSNGLELLHVTSNDESSSLLPLKRHAELYPQVKEESRILVTARRLDHLLKEIGHNPADYNVLHLDIQGAELKALKGAAATLPGIDAISTEVNYEELYEGCPLVEDLDEFLEPFEFQRMFTATPAHPQWGDAFYLRRPSVTFRNLGQWGRFGNQVFEYAFVKIFGKRHRLAVQTGRWPGNQLFGANDPLFDPKRQFPQHLESTYALADSQVANVPFRVVNYDLCGVFQYHSAYYAPEKAYFRKLLTPVPALKGLLDESLARVRAGAKTLVVLHLRRGDYGYGMFFIAPNAWYQEWLKALWPTLDSPMLYIATDEPAKVTGDFAEYRPVTAADLKLPSFGADYYPDYYVLSQADHVAISNSSYSFSACMLNERGRTFLRPDLFLGRLAPFDPWDAEPLLHRELGILDDKVVAQGVPQYLQKPGDAQLANAVRNWRAQYADSWSLIRGEQLPIVLARDLWAGYRMIRQTNIRSLPLVEAEKQILARVQERLARAAGADRIGPCIAATMFVESAKLPEVDLSSLAGDIQEAIRA